MAIKDRVKEISKGVKPGSSNSKVIGQMVGLGIIAGMRATFAPALVSQYFSRHSNVALGNSSLRFIQSPVASILTKGLSALEIVGDKKTSTPDRTAVPQVFARVASGAFAGAAVAKANNQALLKGILIGGASALAATFGAFYIRRYIDTLPRVKDKYVGAAEDMIAFGIGSVLLK